MNFFAYIAEQLNRQKQKKHLRQTCLLSPTFEDFASNDYLGLNKIHLFIGKSIGGSSGSRLITGNYELVENLESEIADFHEGKSALLFPSGFQLNVGIFSTLASRHDVILYDSACHVSLKEGIRLSMARRIPFPHNRLDILEKKIKATHGTPFVVVESLYSMDGDSPDWKYLDYLIEKYNIQLIVDEAHTGGILGKQGKGACVHYNLHTKVLLRIFTYGKAFALQGASVVFSSSLLKKYFINFCRSFIYTTAPSPILIKALSLRYQQIQEAEEQRQKLWDNVRFFQKELRSTETLFGEGPIFGLRLPEEKLHSAYTKLLQHQFFIKPIFPPTVPAHKAQLRIILHSYNTKQKIQELTQILKSFIH